MIAWSTDAPDWKAIFSTRTQVSWNVVRTVSRVDPPVVTCTVRGLLPASAQFGSEEHTSELQSRSDLVCRLLLEKKKKNKYKQLTDDKHTQVNSKRSKIQRCMRRHQDNTCQVRTVHCQAVCSCESFSVRV